MRLGSVRFATPLYSNDAQHRVKNHSILALAQGRSARDPRLGLIPRKGMTSRHANYRVTNGSFFDKYRNRGRWDSGATPGRLVGGVERGQRPQRKRQNIARGQAAVHDVGRHPCQ